MINKNNTKTVSCWPRPSVVSARLQEYAMYTPRQCGAATVGEAQVLVVCLTPFASVLCSRPK